MALDQIRIPRWLVIGPSHTKQLHIFSDASELAMGAAAYIRSTDADGRTTVHLLTSKSRVVPTKKQIIPRLKL